MTTWKDVERPARKAEYRYKFVRLSCPLPEDGQSRAPGDPALPIHAGDALQITMRRNARDTRGNCSTPNVADWGDIRVLELRWICPCCGSRHAVFIPESWLDDGRAGFVEPGTLTHNEKKAAPHYDDDFRDAAEFEARVAAIMADPSCSGRCYDCQGYGGERLRERYKNSFVMCRLKRARLTAEHEME